MTSSRQSGMRSYDYVPVNSIESGERSKNDAPPFETVVNSRSNPVSIIVVANIPFSMDYEGEREPTPPSSSG